MEHFANDNDSLFVLGIVGIVWVLIFHVKNTDYLTEEGVVVPVEAAVEGKDKDIDSKDEEAD